MRSAKGQNRSNTLGSSKLCFTEIAQDLYTIKGVPFLAGTDANLFINCCIVPRIRIC